MMTRAAELAGKEPMDYQCPPAAVWICGVPKVVVAFPRLCLTSYRRRLRQGTLNINSATNPLILLSQAYYFTHLLLSLIWQRKLVNPTPNRFEQLVTQMKWRLNEGGGEAIYRLGVDDDGHVSGLSPKELESSLATLRRMAQRLNAVVQPLRERTVSVSSPPNSCQTSLPASYGSETRKAVELLVRQSPLANSGVSISLAGVYLVGSALTPASYR
ncbi:hypothetical protein X801_01417 [Opisthorchis viverrini]|uniref:Uncharacterized protein n=1 Tax=Opisthorchis viverrini TaxID=6198 RepID=A0A1S8X7L3_OPIVI|nr:hypothetical protein X801_01417 [Opisthorchis viverrini]